MKDNHFKLSSSFTNLFANKDTSQQNPLGQKKQETTKSLDKGLFKLNPKSAKTLEDVPVDMLRKKSKNKLESLKDQGKQKWSIFTQKAQPKQLMKQKKAAPKKYHLDISSQGGKKQKESGQQMQQQLPYNIVKPSRLQNVTPPLSSEIKKSLQPTIIQTPLLPCFASEFRQSNIDQPPSISNFKVVQEKDGVWKIGKMKIKGDKAKLSIGAIQFEASRAQVSGRAAVISDSNFYELQDWNGLWVAQPSEAMFR